MEARGVKHRGRDLYYNSSATVRRAEPARSSA